MSQIPAAVCLLEWLPQTLRSSSCPHSLPRAGMLTGSRGPTQLHPRSAYGEGEAVVGALSFLYP